MHREDPLDVRRLRGVDCEPLRFRRPEARDVCELEEVVSRFELEPIEAPLVPRDAVDEDLGQHARGRVRAERRRHAQEAVRRRIRAPRVVGFPVRPDDLRELLRDDLHGPRAWRAEPVHGAEGDFVGPRRQGEPHAPVVPRDAVDGYRRGDRRVRRHAEPSVRLVHTDDIAEFLGTVAVDDLHAPGGRRPEVGDVGEGDHVSSGVELQPVEAPLVPRNPVHEDLPGNAKLRMEVDRSRDPEESRCQDAARRQVDPEPWLRLVEVRPRGVVNEPHPGTVRQERGHAHDALVRRQHVHPDLVGAQGLDDLRFERGE